MVGLRNTLLICSLACLGAAIRFPSYIGNSMVFQRNVGIPLSGFDTSGATITVTFLGLHYNTVADAAGAWTIMLPQQSASSTPTSILIESNRSPSVTLEDIVFGDVVVCSGQSNMELSIIATVNQSETIADAGKYGASIRILQVATSSSYYNVTTPQVRFLLNFSLPPLHHSHPRRT
jgi:sialate O-acetylesterase